MSHWLFDLLRRLLKVPRAWGNTLSAFPQTEEYKKYKAQASLSYQVYKAKADAARHRYAPLTWVALAPLAIIGGAGIAFGLQTDWLWFFLILAFMLVAARRGRIPDDPAQAEPGWQRLAREGFWEFALVVVVTGIALFWRVTTAQKAVSFLTWYFMISIPILAVLYRQEADLARMFKSLVGLIVGPIGIAWFAVSLLYAGVTFIRTMGELRQHTHTPYEHVRSARADRMSRWSGPRVAVLLSGGGYRAALTHAGLLWVLDEAGIPIHLMSTVSGGSIIGACYALGWEPLAYKNFLAQHKPGLPNDRFNFIPWIGELLCPAWTSGDTYALHFWRVYYHNHTLQETGPTILIINTTDYAEGRREAFWPMKPGVGSLARLVAASGAFPVAFDPVRLGDRRYIDGGVVENLGVEGLRAYLAASEEMPRVLIISDLSAEVRAPYTWLKPPVLQTARHAQEVSYASLHGRVYDRFTGEHYNRKSAQPLMQPYEISPGLLGSRQVNRIPVFILAPTSPAEAWHFAGHENLRSMVAGLSTLAELSRDEAEAAFWVGAKLAYDYLPSICRVMGIEPCPSIKIPPSPGSTERSIS